MLSALTDNQTIMVTYDGRRGEPRGRLTKDSSAVLGDCIDCHQCVTVCPTGIDIRDGIQLECVNCTACMDACDGVMTRLGRATGLIRYASHASIWSGARARLLTPRAAGYTAVWVVLLAAATTLLVTRRDVDVLVLRQPGTLYATLATGDVANFYQVQAFNRTARPATFTIEVSSPRGATLTTLGQVGRIDAYGQLDGRVMLQVPRTALAGASTPVRFLVRTSDGRQQQIDSAFLGPAAAAAR
jgi:cytochrome c oxidase accessory protein FixG